MKPLFLLVIVTTLCASCSLRTESVRAESAAVIDVHLHAGPSSHRDESDDAQVRRRLKELDEHGVVAAIVGGPPADVERMRRAAPKRLIGSVAFPCSDGLDPNLFECFEAGGDWPDLQWLRKEVDAGRIGALGELYNVYAGISPSDPRMTPYFDLAAEYDLVVLAHSDSGPPPQGRVRGCCPNFDGDLGRPGRFEAPLTRHPQLRLVLFHVFRPGFVEEAIDLMNRYPNVMVETSPMTRAPRTLVYAALEAFIDAGHGDRIVFGSDYGGQVGGSLNVIELASFLSPGEKRAILYDNAARLLGIESKP